MFRSLLSLCLVAATLVAAGPCDLYASGGTPCVAAHSTTRALFSAYSKSLYQIKRGSDGKTANIAPLSAGGVANAAAQDSFCASTTCLITTIYDQSGRGNHLTKAPPGTANSGTDPDGFDNLAAADGAPVTLNGHKAYGVFIPPGTGYRNDATNGIATGDGTEGMYAVFDGGHFNNKCCFDYGNAEVKNNDPGNGHMEAIYFGTGGPGGAGTGPWVGADLENGLFPGNTRSKNNNSASLSSRFATAVLKGKPGAWALRGGNSASGGLKTFFSGARPAGGYNPMKLEGAIVLGVGGDNSNRGQGTFYEGVMTAGFPSDATENAVQANIVAAKYATTAIVSGPVVNVGSHISLRATTACCTNRFISHTAGTVNTQVVTSSSSAALRQAASWTVVKGLANGQCISLQSRDPSFAANSFIRFSSGKLLVNANDGSKQFKEDATFCPRIPLNGKGHSYRSWNHPARYFRHFNAVMYAASNGGRNDFDATKLFNDDASFTISNAFA
ncbi:glycoside hydrolase family 54 protein [Mycena amicta]|nr:glycoside hydrolase family 54 protein [Mycena amicta]